MRTLWVPSGDSERVRNLYRAVLSSMGWRPGTWHRCEVTRISDGPSHVCLPTGAGIFLIPPVGLPVPPELARTLSRQLDTTLLALSPSAVQVVIRGRLELDSPLFRVDPAAVARLLRVEVEVVRALLDVACEPDLAGSAPAESSEAWELVALRVA